MQTAYEHGLVPLGLDLETVEPVTWNLAKGNLLYLTDKEEQMTAFGETHCQRETESHRLGTEVS